MRDDKTKRGPLFNSCDSASLQPMRRWHPCFLSCNSRWKTPTPSPSKVERERERERERVCEMEKMWNSKLLISSREIGSGWVTYTLAVVTLVFVWQFTRFQILPRLLFLFRGSSAGRFNNPTISILPSSQQHRFLLHYFTLIHFSIQSFMLLFPISIQSLCVWKLQHCTPHLLFLI